MDLRPERATAYVLEMPLAEPFETSFGVTRTRSIALVRLTREGCEGWGESVADHQPRYSAEYTEGVLLAWERVLFPLLASQPLIHPGEWPRRCRSVKGHPMAKAAVEMALWDLYGKIQGRSLADLWGGVRESVPVGVSIGLQPDDEALIDRIEAYLDEGYGRIKLKIKPGRDLEMLARVRKHFPEIPLTVDANGAYRPGRDLQRLTTLDRFDLQMIEQPFPPDEWLGHRALQARIKTPLCLDESIPSPGALRLALRLKAARIINLKPGRVGGYAVARRMHDLCRRRGVPVWCGGMLETGIGRAANVALASLPGFTYPNDLSASRRYWRRDIVEPEFELQPGSRLAVPQEPGLGVTVVMERLHRYMVRRWSYDLARSR